MLEQEIFPIAATITGNIAVVQYNYVVARENHKKDRETVTGQYTDVLVKENGRGSSSPGRAASTRRSDEPAGQVTRHARTRPAHSGKTPACTIAARPCLTRYGCDLELPVQQRAFLYLPCMHSESPVIHEEALRLFATPGLAHNLDFERRHKAVIDRFGRYPHRNAALGRASTAEELDFLQQPGSGC